MSVVSRAWRADELRTIGFVFQDDQSKLLWDAMRLADFPVLVPHRPGKHSRAEKEAEIRAQFDAFQKTGLALDHVNAHNHMHLHPTVLGLILKVGREFGLKAVRVPYEPFVPSWLVARKAFVSRLAVSLLLFPWIALLRRRLGRASIRSNQFVFGLNDSGSMHLDLVLRMLKRLPQGVTEIYFHPAMSRCPELIHTMPTYDHQSEFETLTHPHVREALHATGAQTIAYSDLGEIAVCR